MAVSEECTSSGLSQHLSSPFFPLSLPARKTTHPAFSLPNRPHVLTHYYRKDTEKECPGEDDPRDTGPPGDEDDPRDVPRVTIFIKAKASVLQGGQPVQQAMAGQQVKLFAPATADVALPGPGAARSQADFDQDPIQGMTDSNGDARFSLPAAQVAPSLANAAPALNALGFNPTFEISVDTTQQGSQNIQLAGANAQAALALLPDALKPFVSDATGIADSVFVTVTYPTTQEARIQQLIATIPGIITVEINFCRDKQEDLNDPYFRANGSWGQPYPDQWALPRIGLTADTDSAWNLLGESPQPVTVAVIDTGIDWNHLDLDWKNLWRNVDEIPDNDVDDDNNGYVDDIIGWDFYGRHNKPWDHDGHGTFVAGLIAATQNNDVGMAGINPHARIMVLKALNSFGHSRASYLAKAIVYAADNGARIINIERRRKEPDAHRERSHRLCQLEGCARRRGGRKRGRLNRRVRAGRPSGCRHRGGHRPRG